MPPLDGRRIAFVCAPEGTEQIELTRPWKELADAGASTRLLSTRSGQVQAFDHLDRADTFDVDETVGNADPADFDALVLPGGVANPDLLRTDAGAVAFVRSFFDRGRPVAAICHAPWTLIEAGVLEGRVVTSWPSLQTDIRNAGATWQDEEVVVCDRGDSVLVTSRRPDDLDAFCRRTIEAFAA